MMTPRQLLIYIRETLEDAGMESAGFESRLLLETVLRLPHSAPLPEIPVTKIQLEQAKAFLERRLAHEPLQYLCGTWEFYGMEFSVGEGVLIPRQDTETLVETVLTLRKGMPATKLLDLCSGTGCIPAAIAAHLPNVTGVALEFSRAAFGYLEYNLQKHAPQMTCVLGDACSPPAQLLEQTFDLITCNPPYLTTEDMTCLQPEVAKEPKSALFGGADGLDFYRRLTPIWKNVLHADGWLLYEVGAGQAEHVCCLMDQNGFTSVDCIKDLCGIARVVMGQNGTKTT